MDHSQNNPATDTKVAQQLEALLPQLRTWVQSLVFTHKKKKKANSPQLSPHICSLVMVQIHTQINRQLNKVYLMKCKKLVLKKLHSNCVYSTHFWEIAEVCGKIKHWDWLRFCVVLDRTHAGCAMLLPCIIREHLGKNGVSGNSECRTSCILSLSAERILWVSKVRRWGRTCMLPCPTWGSVLFYNQTPRLRKEGYPKLNSIRPMSAGITASL